MMLGSLWHDLVEEDLKKQRVVSLPQAAGPVGLPRGEEIFLSFSSSPCLLLEKVRKSMVGVICMAGH